MTTLDDVVLARLPLANPIVIVPAKLCDRFVNVTKPFVAIKLVMPCKMPVPAARDAVTTVLLSALRRLPNWSSI